MPTRRLIPTLLALLAVVASVGVPAATVLCRGDGHVALEFAAAALHCDTPVHAETSGTGSAVDADCSDSLIELDVPARPTSSVDAVPAPVPPLLIAVLPAEDEPSFVVGQWPDRDAAPPPHLLPLRSFILLT